MFAEVILPRPVEGTFTYRIPDAMQSSLRPGMRVLVQFGSRHYYTGLVDSLTPVKPVDRPDIKEIEGLLDTSPVVRHPQVKFWRWMAQYYLCTLGDVYKAALPSGLNVQSETLVELNPEALRETLASLGERDRQLVTLLSEEGKTSTKDIAKKLRIERAEAIVSRLIKAGVVMISEKMVERYRAVRRSYVRPTLPRADKGALLEAFGRLRKGSRQEAAFLNLIALSAFNKPVQELREVALEELMENAGVTRANIKALADKGLCEIYTREISRFSYSGAAGGRLPVLSPAQDEALKQIHRSFSDHAVTLLHGVTSSGKTEIYIHLIDYVLRKGDSVLFLVPEIALTTQLTRRLQSVFGDKVVIYHSKFSDNERVDIWRRLLDSSEASVIIGARSAVFLPFSKLGLVIVDEEHESSYKQADPAPRYNGRDAATMLAAMHGAKTLFGSATPTIETYYKASTGKFGLVSLTERFEGATLPEIELIDMAAERRNSPDSRPDGIISMPLLRRCRQALADDRQVVLFHNRRGYSPMARCRLCQFVPKCDHCDVSLTYHRRPEALVCHYCGSQYPVPRVCPNCHEPAIEIVGHGTERLEEDINAHLSDYRVLRMDLDTTRNKDGYSRIIDDFSEHKADVLVGTQMVTKGLDFGAVELVGILNADSIINYPDFRSAERAFNMLEQVAGRAGRRADRRGRVVVQTYNPTHPVIGFLRKHDYAGFYARELEERRAFGYPPFSKIIDIYVKHRDPRTADSCAAAYAEALRRIFGNRVNGPQETEVGRVASLYIRKIMLKIESGASMQRVKEILREQYIALTSSPTMRALTVYYDVDPV